MNDGAGTFSAWYNAFRTAIFALLVCDTAYYLYAGTPSKGLDALAWLLLLVLFALETGFAGLIRAQRTTMVMRAVRLVAAAGVCVSGAGYIIEHDTLDAINSGLWVAVVVLLELEVRRPLDVARHRAWFTAAAAMLYTGLAVLVLVWAWRGEWLDAYDAVLWLMAFATIEMDVLTETRPGAPV